MGPGNDRCLATPLVILSCKSLYKDKSQELNEELHEQGHKLEAQKACYKELSRVQQTQHQQLSEQMKEFADVQKQKIDVVSHQQR